VKAKILTRKLLCEDLLKKSVSLLQGEEGWNKEEDYLAWKKWCIQKIIKRLEVSEEEAEKQFDFFDLCMGPNHNFGLFAI
jgi:hypothetical protein